MYGPKPIHLAYRELTMSYIRTYVDVLLHASPVQDPSLLFCTVQVVQVLKTVGYCMVPPPGCPRGIYSLMVNCWLVHVTEC